ASGLIDASRGSDDGPAGRFLALTSVAIFSATWALTLPSVTDDFHQHPLAAPAVELAVENLLPGTEIELSFGDCHHNLAPHDLTLHVRIGVVFPRVVVPVLVHWLVRRELLQPLLVILVQSAFVVVDEDRRGDVHRIHENESFPDTGFANALSDLRRDVDKTSPGRNVEPEFVSIALHKSAFL